MFNNVEGAAISGDALNVVHRDQYNGTTINNTQVVRIKNIGRVKVQRESEHDRDSEYGQYREIIRGDINNFEQLDWEDHWDCEWKDGRFVCTCHSYRRTVHKAHVYGDDSVFTAISYHGRDAKKIWKKEFMEWSQAGDPAVLLQLFAINRSNVPTFLFHDEWLPLGHLQSKVEGTSFWESYYLRVYVGVWDGLYSTTSLENQRKCPQFRYSGLRGKLWLDSRTGRVSSGPQGPSANFIPTTVLYDCKDMPSIMDMATADTCVRFFNQTGAGNLDRDVLAYAHAHCLWRYSNESPLKGADSPDRPTHYFCKRGTRHSFWHCHCCDRIPWDEAPDLIGKLRLDTVYSGAQLDKIAISKEGPAYKWYTDDWDALSDQTLIDSGLTRLRFDGGSQKPSQIQCYIGVPIHAWLSQGHRLDLPTSGPETCFIPFLVIELRFGVSDLDALPIVYLFLRPPPPCLADIDSWWLSQISFWSFDENGTSEIPEEECERLGLPNIILKHALLRFYSYGKYVYDGLHAWQVARGFDPSTADWARSLGLPILEPATTRFKQVVEEEPLTRSSPPKPNANSIPDDPPAINQLSPPTNIAGNSHPQKTGTREAEASSSRDNS